MLKPYASHITATAAGLVFWKLAQVISGTHEVWDAPSFLWFYTAALVLSAALGYLFPKGAGLWGAIVMFAQFPIMMIGSPPVVGANMWPIGLIMTGFLAIPAVGAAIVGAYLPKPRAPS